MEIVIKCETRDYEERQEMSIDGADRLYVGPLSESPEDAIIGRSLVSCSDVAGFMEEAYQAGKNGEEFSIKYVEEPDDGEE